MIENLSEVERFILNQLQEGIPLVPKPFEKLSSDIGISEKEYIETIYKLKEKKIIRQISPIYDTKTLGYDSSLVAFKIDNIEKSAEIINSYPGVSHNYERNNEFNLWFTIAVPPDSKLGLEKTVEILAKETGVKDYVILRTVKLYKIKVKLDVKGSITEKETPTNSKTKPENYLLTEEDKKVIKITQVDIPLVSRPFKEFGMKLNLSEGEVINKLKSYLENGIMRRFVAILFHRNVGFKSNGMVVWKINKEKVDELGYKLASFKNVSHCYERTTNKNWKYNLFSMIHAKSSKDIENFVEKFAKEENIEDYKILYSTREFKKRRIKYFSDEFYRWENRYTKN